MKQTLLLLLSSAVVLSQSCRKDDVKPRETVLYETDFSSDDGQWPTGTLATGVSADIQNNYYQITSRNTSYYVYASSRFNGVSGNTAIEASVSVSAIGNPATLYPGGLAWNINPSRNLVFMFGIYPDGQFAIGGWPDANGFVSYKDPTTSTAIRTGGFNTLRIELRNKRLYFFINGTQVHDMSPVNDSSLDLPGLILGGPDLSMRTDHFKAVQF
ncbi:hypothetical protein [Niabella beijingensis]|uniref:hypothetical protein n=1 Tax=Niabella beijingensis TaxID=2872700 RepID=UPI001CBBA8EE|nr:hypothetical protein [Niabella beijingensis]MBZ4187502.1 hypothetical protein [Niabella beijingensis]